MCGQCEQYDGKMFAKIDAAVDRVRRTLPADSAFQQFNRDWERIVAQGVKKPAEDEISGQRLDQYDGA